MKLKWKSGGRQRRDWRGEAERLVGGIDQNTSLACMKVSNNKQVTR